MTATAILDAPISAPAATEIDPAFVVLSNGLSRWQRGDVFVRSTFRQEQKLADDVAEAELNRLLCLGAIRLATRGEAEQNRVALVGQNDRHVSYETLLASKEAELVRARERIAHLEEQLARGRQEGQLPSLPPNVEGMAGLLRAKDEQFAAIQKELTAALAANAVNHQPAQPATFSPAPPPAAAPLEPAAQALPPGVAPPPARSAESRAAAESRTSRRGGSAN